jgi:hypothetical protein
MIYGHKEGQIKCNGHRRFLPSPVIVKLTWVIPCQVTQKEGKNNSIYTLQALSRNFGKRLLASSYLSVRRHGTIRLPLDRF